MTRLSDVWTDGRVRTDGRMDGRVRTGADGLDGFGRIGRVYGWTDGLDGRWTDRTDGRIRRTDGRTDGRTGRMDLLESERFRLGLLSIANTNGRSGMNP